MPAELPDSDWIAVLTPTSRPALSSSGPPELPGLIAASVWITPATSRNSVVGSSRPSALTIPCVSVRCKPYGLPIAYTDWPMRSSRELPSGIGRRVRRARTSRTTARS